MPPWPMRDPLLTLLEPLPEGPPGFRPRRYARHPWAPMTDAEWALIEPLVTPILAPRRGRPAENPRRSWDAIFWVACSSGPWRSLPEHLGKPDTAHRTLRRAARAGVLGRLLLGLSDRPEIRRVLDPLGWRIARAWRRATRLLNIGQLLFAKHLGLLDALPCPPDRLPRPFLSETVLERARILVRWPGNRALLRHCLDLHRLMAGDRRCWRLTD
ncbi:MAG: hypothetical protein RLZZ187_193 [Pseudomonadota bacterium]